MAQKVFTDTTDFFAIDNGDIISIGGKKFKIIGHAKELRFGIEDPKFWVKRALELDTDERKIIKLAFFETFETSLAGVKIQCFRNPEKEGNILNLVNGHPFFMQGETYTDDQGNNVRVLEVVRGKTFLAYIDSFRMPYEIYFQNILAGILKKLIRAFEGVLFLHSNGFRHGDIRNDHIIVEGETGNYVWIDFDYDFEATENPFSLDIFGMGNILTYAIGKGFHSVYMIKNDPYKYGDLFDRLDDRDFALLDQRRLVNLRKLYPIIPETLTNVLMHFSKGADVYYEYTDEIIEDLNCCLQAFTK